MAEREEEEGGVDPTEDHHQREEDAEFAVGLDGAVEHGDAGTEGRPGGGRHGRADPPRRLPGACGGQ